MKTNKKAIKSLWEAFDRIEGEYSNIPECCVSGFLEGRTYMNVYNSLSSKKDKNKLSNWGYVPCEDCFNNNKKNKIKLNGTSVTGRIIHAIIKSIEENK